MIERMFEQAGMGRAAGDSAAAPIPPALPEVSAPEQAEETGPVRRWREAAPGPEMMAALASVSLPSCTDGELLDVLAGWERAAAWVAGQQMRALERTRQRLYETAVGTETDLDGNTRWEAVYRQIETEIATAMRWTSPFTIHRLDIAQQVSERLPHVLDAMNAGQIGYRHAEMFWEETRDLTVTQARRLIDEILPEATSKTIGGLRRRLRTACLQLDPASGNERAHRAKEERSVTIRPLTDGLAQLEAIGPAEAILAMFRVLNDTARQAPKTDPRTRTARRFDALIDVVLTGAFRPEADPDGLHPSPADTPDDPGLMHDTPDGTSPPARSYPYESPEWPYDSPRWPFGSRDGAPGCPPAPKIPALVQITMDLPTLLGLRDNPAELHGYGPLPAALARTLAADADWQRFLHDPLTGAPQDLGRTRRHPTAGLRRWIIARDKTCLFPECYRPAKDCEPDHNPAWEHHGRTDKDTLHQLCPKHHKVRHHGWHYQRHPDRISWTSPHRETYERYFREADLIGPDQTCPHQDTDHDDTIWPPTHDDQSLTIWLPKDPNRYIEEFRRPAPDIPWDIVNAFRLDDDDDDIWPVDDNGIVLDEYIPTPEQEQAILDREDWLTYGDPPPPPIDDTHQRLILDRTHNKPHDPHYYDRDPPF